LHPALNIDGAAHSINDTDKLYENAVACRFYNAAAILGDFWINQLATVCL
jgi:hypothetical protein